MNCIGMVVWVKAGTTEKQPNDQRFRIEGIGNGHLLVTSLGDETKVVAVQLEDVCGIELDENHAIRFNSAYVSKP